MNPTRLVLSIAAGIVLGGLALCGIGGLLVGHSFAPSRRSESPYARRDTVLSQAKTIGLAALLYSGDNNDALPGTQDFRDKVRPYLTSRSASERLKADLGQALDRFVWSYPGGVTTQDPSPRETEIGRLYSPDGYAAVRLDGSAVWVDKTTR